MFTITMFNFKQSTIVDPVDSKKVLSDQESSCLASPKHQKVWEVLLCNGRSDHDPDSSNHTIL